MFDLEQAITEWRQQMLAGGIKTPELLDELESHLREDIERQTRTGQGVQQAFEFAIQQFGQPYALKGEFAKVDGIDKISPMATATLGQYSAGGSSSSRRLRSLPV